MNTQYKRSFQEYIFIPLIIAGQFAILIYLNGRDGGIFSWPRLLFPNLWLLLTSLAWYKWKPLPNLNLGYQIHPRFILGLTAFLSLAILYQFFFVPIHLYEPSAVNVYKFIFLSSIVPFSEELFFRGLFFYTLVRDFKNVHVASLVVALFFSIFHLPQGLMVVAFLFVLSLILSYLVLMSGGLLCGILVHICMNALYYNKLLDLTAERLIFSLVVITALCLLAWKGKRNELSGSSA